MQLRKPDFKQQILPHLIVLGVFFIIVFVYFKPAFTENKALFQSDRMQYRGMSKQIIDQRKTFEEEPLWSGSMFAGMPTYTYSVVYGGEKIIEFLEMQLFHLKALFQYPISIVIATLISTYIMLLCFGISPPVAAIGAVMYTFASNTIISLEAGHTSKLRAMAFAPLVLAGVRLTFDKKYLWGLVLAAMGAAIHLRTAHYQITYYLLFILAGLVINEFIKAIKSKQLKAYFISAGLLAGAALIGVGPSTARLMTTLEYLPHSMRGKTELTADAQNNNDQTTLTSKKEKEGLDKDYVFQWSLGKSEILTLLIPNFYGGKSGVDNNPDFEMYSTLRRNNISPNQLAQLPMYWGNQPFTSGPNYMGAITVFIFILGAFLLKGKQKYWLMALTLLSLLLVMGKNLPSFNYFMYDHFPGYNKFRSVTMSVFIAQLSMVLMAVYTLNKLTKATFIETIEIKKLYYAIGVAGGLCLMFWLVPGLAGSFSSDNDVRFLNSLAQFVAKNNPRVDQNAAYGIFNSALVADRKSMLSGDAFRSLIFILLAGGVFYLLINKKIKPQIALLLVGVLALVDLWSVDKRYLNEENFKRKAVKQYFEPTPADQQILQDNTPGYRVLNLNNPFNESKTSYYHRSVGGYSPVKVRRYQDLIENDLTNEIQGVISELQNRTFVANSLQKYNVINMLNTKYLKAGEQANAVIANPFAAGNAWFIKNLVTVSSPNEELSKISEINIKTEAVIDTKKFPIDKTEFTVTPQANIELVGKVSKNGTMFDRELVYNIKNPNEGFAVFSQIYYPVGWKLTIDGNEAPIYRVNYALRGAVIPSGEHTVIMRFDPNSYVFGNSISMISSLLILAGFVFAIGYTFVKKEA